MKIKLNKYVWFGLQGFRQSAGNPGSPQEAEILHALSNCGHLHGPEFEIGGH